MKNKCIYLSPCQKLSFAGPAGQGGRVEEAAVREEEVEEQLQPGR